MKILAVGAHPDDVELLCAGTLARLAESGHDIAICSITGGEYGSKTLPPQQVRQLRMQEGESAASLIKAKFYPGTGRDKHFIFNEEVRNDLCEIVRIVAPDVLFAHAPKDYVLDHDFSSMLTRDCATAATCPTFKTGIQSAAPPTSKIPYLYYCEPSWGVNVFGEPVPSSTYVDITAVIETKRKMLACHASQFEFVHVHHRGENDLERLIEESGRRNGKVIGCTYAEGFRQHLSPPFPKENILIELVGARHVRTQEVTA